LGSPKKHKALGRVVQAVYEPPSPLPFPPALEKAELREKGGDPGGEGFTGPAFKGGGVHGRRLIGQEVIPPFHKKAGAQEILGQFEGDPVRNGNSGPP
jgi:hypothetical protein